MDMNTVKRAVDSIELGADAKERILSGLTAGNAPVRRRRRLRPGALIAAAVVAALLVTGAGAACRMYFSNTRVLSPGENPEKLSFSNPDITDSDAPTGYSVAIGGTSSEGITVEELLDIYIDGPVWEKLRNWDNNVNLGGSTRGSYKWTGFEVLENDGDMLVRDVFDRENHAVKRERISFDPADFAPYIADFINVDFETIEEDYSPIGMPELFYTINDRWGALKGVYFQAHYADESGANFQLDFTADRLVENLTVIPQYILAEEYDCVYTYTNANGIEFLICVSGECVSAESRFFVDEGRSRTSNYMISLDSSFMTAAEVESVLDCISLAK